MEKHNSKTEMNSVEESLKNANVSQGMAQKAAHEADKVLQKDKDLANNPIPKTINTDKKSNTTSNQSR